MNTLPRTRCGWLAISQRAHRAPIESETSTARSVPVASSTALAARACSSLP
jgi:hypothetical protein